ncbi:hypothetical protein P9112_012741 [Eukaryota sp. TZLM1-RC]
MTMPSDTLSPYSITVFDPQAPKKVDKFFQEHENDIAELILVHEPGIEIFMGSMHPNGALYEKPVNLRVAQKQHRTFVKTLKDNHIRVFTVREVLALNCDSDLKSRIQLEDFAFNCLHYNLCQNSPQLTASEQRFVGDEYKREAISAMDTEQLVELIITQPTVTLSKSDINTELVAESHAFKPLGNLVFCRDQQIVCVLFSF